MLGVFLILKRLASVLAGEEFIIDRNTCVRKFLDHGRIFVLIELPLMCKGLSLKVNLERIIVSIKLPFVYV